MTIKIFTEIGIGNATIVNTELEYPDGMEIRQPGYVKGIKYHKPYVRLWIGKTVWILARLKITKQIKPYKAFKLIFGLQGF